MFLRCRNVSRDLSNLIFFHKIKAGKYSVAIRINIVPGKMQNIRKPKVHSSDLPDLGIPKKSNLVIQLKTTKYSRDTISLAKIMVSQNLYIR